MLLNIIICIFSYFIGNILGGKVLKVIYGSDLSTGGSGNIGARNAGRLLGSKAFLFVLTIDFFKGFLVVIILKLLDVSYVIISIAIFLVVLGHIKPILNKFKGGKGVATFAGAITALSPNLFFIIILGILLISFVTRSLTIGFYSTLPSLVYIHYLDFKSIYSTIIFSMVVLMLFIVSKDSIKMSFNKYFNPIKKRRIENK
ncbi:glycerol-3-phosphate acyltransferase [Gemelliphila palaticanis]|uniref:Glycerol-3-phosphate acyltransferase n=1 Tax=Gemelliphila palaticanis TaxID=81950 RepID=A0ABX2T0A8_9BACL|nr:glycerol-3-phosphate acyltransferase [Gemella palaticanis]MBF0715138.1 glycerol-3-phosphate acyltransferase [Gemella palaticanis]NYS47068.1 glycerol-3-phosphate acyltransferase [Gemella palaticanis]